MVAVLPLLLAAALPVALLLRWLAPRGAAAAMVALAALCLAGNGDFTPSPKKEDEARQLEASLERVVDALGNCRFAAGTRIYSTPNDHLRFAYYTGLPVQSIAPVRRSFLDALPHDVVIIEASERYTSLGADRIAEIAASLDEPITPAQSERGTSCWSPATSGATSRARWRAPGRRSRSRRRSSASSSAASPSSRSGGCRQSVDAIPLMRGCAVRDWGDWWKLYAYRFVDPAARDGDRLNYAARRRTSHSLVLPSGCAIHVSTRIDSRPFSPLLLERIDTLCALPPDR
jgi:hypothetical protein